MAKKPSRPVGPVRARASVKQPAKKVTRMTLQNTLGGLMQAGYGSKNYAPRRTVNRPDPLLMPALQKRRSSKTVK